MQVVTVVPHGCPGTTGDARALLFFEAPVTPSDDRGLELAAKAVPCCKCEYETERSRSTEVDERTCVRDFSFLRQRFFDAPFVRDIHQVIARGGESLDNAATVVSTM